MKRKTLLNFFINHSFRLANQLTTVLHTSTSCATLSTKLAQMSQYIHCWYGVKGVSFVYYTHLNTDLLSASSTIACETFEWYFKLPLGCWAAVTFSTDRHQSSPFLKSLNLHLLRKLRWWACHLYRWLLPRWLQCWALTPLCGSER